MSNSSTTPRRVLASVDLAARVTTLLSLTFPEAGPAGGEGFRVLSHDQQEPRRMFVRWYGAEPTRPGWTNGPELGVEKYRARIVETLMRAGYAVTNSPGSGDVYVADRPVDTAGARFGAVPSDLPFSDPWVVLDLWTRVDVTTAAAERDAIAEAMRLDRAHVLEDARRITASAPDLWPHLERADELLGDGVRWLSQEVHDVTRYGDVVEHERIDALVRTANTLRAGREVTVQGRMVVWEEPEPLLRPNPPLYEVRWVPVSRTPSVGFFPAWRYGLVEASAVTLLIGAGLRPVVYGEPIGDGAWMCEQEGFMVSPLDPSEPSVPGIQVDAMGRTAGEQQGRIPEVLRAGGWTVEEDPTWAGSFTAFPPAG
ncbi:hypothetical protein KUF83_30195 [Streptomyces sp. BV286]|uniref:hypothetical protein n=1 Tax=Streptomyces sp. BV286 TaxID=2849672 RepID=UPI001C2E5B5B|nr:hypothetical protein [Streptomyces sp. BV286]MBV1940808.1 hypothetical protein [Streptomyces sp. BV286]